MFYARWSDWPYNTCNIIYNDWYILCVVDNFSKYLFLYVLKTKEQTAECLDQAYQDVQVKFVSRGQVDKLQCDQGTKFTSQACGKVLEKYGVERQYAEANRHEHAGSSEKVNCTIEERLCALLMMRAILVTCGVKLCMQCVGYIIVLSMQVSTLLHHIRSFTQKSLILVRYKCLVCDAKFITSIFLEVQKNSK